MRPTSPSHAPPAGTAGALPPWDQDTHKEVYASPDAHYLGTPNKKSLFRRSDNFPEVKPSDGLEVSHEPYKSDNPAYFVSSKGAADAGHGSEKIVVAPDEAPSPVPRTTGGTNRRKKKWILIIIGAILVILAVVLGAVFGSRAARGGGNGSGSDADGAATSSSSPPSSSSTLESLGSSITITTIVSGSITTTAIVSPPTKSVLSVELPGSSAFDIGQSYNASFTRYGTGDGTHGSNCNVPRNGCGFFSKPGYAAGVSQNLYGKGPGMGKGPACGTCWLLETVRDASGNALSNNITVIVNDLCPANAGSVCRQQSLDDLNSWETQVDFNLCTDSGAADAMFGANTDIGLAIGRATRVDCKSWKGEIQS